MSSFYGGGGGGGLSKKDLDAITSKIFKFKIVTSLPTEDISDSTIYLINTGEEEDNFYTEYVYIDNDWEKFGTQKVDLSNYVILQDLTLALETKVDKDGNKVLTDINYSAVEQEKVNAAYEVRHSHENKTVLDKITNEKIQTWDRAKQNVNADWLQTDSTADDFIKNKPTLGAAAAKDVGTDSNQVAAGDHNHSGVYAPATSTSADLEKVTGYVPIVFSDWHIGNVQMNNGPEWLFRDTDHRRVCLASADKAIPLPAGTVIGLTDYSAAKIFIGWRTGTSGNYTYKIFATRNWIQTDYTTVEDGEYMILIGSAPTEHTQSDLHDLLDLLFIRKPDAVMSDEFRRVSTDIEKVSHKIMNGANLWRLKPHYDHLWIDYVNKQSVIPSESVFSVPISKQLGFDMIEANVNKLTDGNYLVMHPVNGKFGNQVKHVDGVTDISGITVTSVTLDWVKENVRYNSVYDKYCTPPSSLQEFLTECRKNCLVPLIQYVDADMVAIADEMMGKDNYVLYGQQPAARAASDAIMLCWKNLTDIDDIKEWVKAYYPCGYSVANPGDFTDEELAEIVTEVHKLGGLVGFAGSYVTEAVAQKLWSLGFDYSASGHAVNPFQSGNICNLSADADYGDFSTDGSVSGHLLTLAAGNTVSNGTSYDTAFLSAAMLTIRFDGKISVSMGSYITDSNCVLESDGTQSVTLSTYLLEQAPSFRVTAVEQTDVISIAFKAMSASDAVGFTSSDKAKLDGITAAKMQAWDAAEQNVNADWNAESGDAQILNKPDLTVYALAANVTKSALGIDNVDNTSDADKPISTATQTALDGKQGVLTFDNSPTSGSENPVKSGGVYSALAGKISTSAKGANGGVAELDANGKVPSSQLPSYVDDVLAYNSVSAFPVTGEDGKIYIAKDTNLSYRWTGSEYGVISPSLALGSTSSTAYRGDWGAEDRAAIGTLSTLNTTEKSNLVGAINELKTVSDTKQITLTFDSAPASGSTNPVTSGGVYTALAGKADATATQTALAEKQNALTAGANITIETVNDALTISATDTTYSAATTSAAGLMSAADKTKLGGIASGAEVNVQSDWNQSDTTADDFIKNKPTNASASSAGLMSAADFKKINAQGIATNSDLNDIKGEGWYACSGNAIAATLSHCPTDKAFYLEVHKHAGVYQHIVEFSVTGAKHYHRNYYNYDDVWGNWEEWKLTDTTYSDATQQTHGLMSTADKTKLDGIQTGAAAVSITQTLASGTKIGTVTVNGTGTDLYCETNTDTTYSAGTGISISNGEISNSAPNVQADWNASGTAAEILNKPTIPNYSNATPSTNGVGGSAGLMSAIDKEKLDKMVVLSESNYNSLVQNNQVDANTIYFVLEEANS